MSRDRTRSATARFTRCGLAALLFVGFPANGLVEGASTAAPSASSGILSVESDPPGAAVFVDGEALGTTPIAVRTLPAGDHRVRVAMEGYLDNSRVVRLQGGQAERVKVKLTRNEMAAAPQVDPQPAKKSTEKKGSGKKWALIGLGAAAVAAGAYVLTKNSAPVPGTITVSPTATGMAGITTFTFTSVGSSDPDNDPLTYDWAFGDGGTGSGSSTSHVYAGAGTNTVSLTVSDRKHTVTAPSATVTVARNLTGNWNGRVAQVGNPTTIRITQSGGSLSGTLTFGPPADTTQRVWCVSTCSGSIAGTVGSMTYPTPASFSGNIGGLVVTFTGVSSDGSTLTGTANWNIGITGGGTTTFTRE